jgi:hypothetical protein
MTTVERVHDVPATIRALATPHDYVDLFVAGTPQATLTSPEQWARAAIEHANPVGTFLAWRAVCGLHLDDNAPEHIGGWRIADRGHDWIRLAAAGRFMSAQMVFHVDRGQVGFATFVRYDSLSGRLIWNAASVVHRRVAPDFLRGAVRRVERMHEPAA